MKRETLVSYGFRIEQSSLRQLEKFADRDNQRPSELVREIITRYISRRSRRDNAPQN